MEEDEIVRECGACGGIEMQTVVLVGKIVRK
jgi:hypothetical protein